MAMDPSSFVEWLAADRPLSESECREMEQIAGQIEWTPEEWQQWFAEMAATGAPLEASRIAVAERLLQSAALCLRSSDQLGDTEFVGAIGAWFHRSADHERLAALLLSVLSGSGQAVALETFVSLLLHRPPRSPANVATAFYPLFSAPQSARRVFPRLLDGMAHTSLAAAVLDLANFLVRSATVRTHPAAPRASELVELLGTLVRRLEQCEEQTVETSDAFHRVARQVAEATAIAISLCDALALMGAEAAIPKLYPLLEVRHRRLQVEAAAALARLGDATGREKLAELAAEPVVRMYAVRFAEELGMLEAIPQQYRTTEALVVARAALMLSQPTHFGVPPSDLELIARRTLPWPGEEEPAEVFLVRYGYTTPQGDWSNVAAVGPTVGICTADLADLSPDDIFAIFAGMETAHEEIRHWDREEWTEHHLAEVARLERRLRDRGYRRITPQLVGTFFGEWFLIARATRDATEGLAVADAEEVRWFPTAGPRPLGTAELLALYKGRKLIQTFGGDSGQSDQSGSDGI